MVSRSRISPTRMTLGAWRRAARKPWGYASKSAPISRWLMVEYWCEWWYSTGSSSVTMWTAWVRLISLMTAASVVVLPEPVAPVTSTRPFFSLAILRKRSSMEGMVELSFRITTAQLPPWRKMFTRKRAWSPSW